MRGRAASRQPRPVPRGRAVRRPAGALQPRARVVRGVRGRGPAPTRPARRWRWVLAAVLLLLMVFWLWPAEPVPAPVPPPEPPPAPVATKPVVKKSAPKKPTPKPAAPAPVPAASQRALLRKAVEARAPDLRACSLPPGAPAALGTKIRVSKSGATRGVTLSPAQPLPRELAECLRQRILQWEFSDVGLSSDVEIFVNFALGT